jgi:hypothetical protein
VTVDRDALTKALADENVSVIVPSGNDVPELMSALGCCKRLVISNANHKKGRTVLTFSFSFVRKQLLLVNGKRSCHMKLVVREDFSVCVWPEDRDQVQQADVDKIVSLVNPKDVSLVSPELVGREFELLLL